MGALSAVPRPAAATTTLLMVSPNPDDASAMTTDVTLLLTRAVAARVVADLGLRESPEQLLSSVTATPVSSQVLEVRSVLRRRAAAVARAHVARRSTSWPSGPSSCDRSPTDWSTGYTKR